MHIWSKIAYVVIAAVLLCGCYNSADMPERVPTTIVANATLTELRGLWRGATFEVDKPMIVGGYVTSTDSAGNFYRTLTISDGVGAAEIMAGMRDLHNTYPIGSYLYVKLDGCAVGVERGVLQIGLMPASYSSYAVDYFYSRVMLDRHIVQSGRRVDVPVAKVGIDALERGMCGMLVRVEGLKVVSDLPTEDVSGSAFEQGEDVIVPATWSGYRAFADELGRTIYVYTSEYATFATAEVPTATCTITGILQYGKVSGVAGEWYCLKMRTKDDCESISDNGL